MPTCPFCGEPQRQYVDGVYKPCNCEKMAKNSDIIRQIKDVELQIDSIDERIASYEEIVVKRWENSNVGKRYMKCTFESYNPAGHERQVEVCRRFANDFENNTDGRGLMLYGTVGTGKTHLAAAVGNYIVYEKGYDVYFMPFTELLNNLKNNMNNKDYIKKFMERLYNADLLIMDDLGKEKYTEWAAEQLFSLLDNRYRDCKPVIVTTNYTPQQLSNRVDEAIMSRLIGTCALIGMNGQDYRTSHRKQPEQVAFERMLP
jgi:DNA replication protein DnaC